MCAHYLIFLDDSDLRDIVKAAERNLGSDTLNFKMGTRDIFPGYAAPVLMPENGGLKPVYMRWGYPIRKKKKIQKDPKHPEYTTSYAQNAKLEEAVGNPFWMDSLKERRCLIPVSGFYEYKTLKSKEKVPYRFSLPGSSVMYMAGMYKFFKQDDGSYFQHYTMCTTAPTTEVAAVHDRMPVVLREAEHIIWLDGDYMSLVDRVGIYLQATEISREEMFKGKGSDSSD